MKKILLFCLVMLSIELPAGACDICGCGVGNYYFGIMPQFHRHFIGVRYRFSSFQSHLGLSARGLFVTKEQFQTTELWARFYPHRKVQLLTFVPYSFNSQTDNATTRHLSGLNDIMVVGNYNLLNTTQDTLPHLFKHNILVGGGVKLPTGKHTYSESDQQQVANANFQLGSGSLDFLLNLTYTLRYKRWGINTDLAYKMNTKNADGYKFGNRTTTNIALFYVQKIKQVGLMPHAGIYVEHSRQDVRKGDFVIETGGYLVAQTLGLDLYYKRFSVGGNYQIPLKQDLAEGHIKSNSRGVVHVTFML